MKEECLYKYFRHGHVLSLGIILWKWPPVTVTHYALRNVTRYET